MKKGQLFLDTFINPRSRDRDGDMTNLKLGIVGGVSHNLPPPTAFGNDKGFEAVYVERRGGQLLDFSQRQSVQLTFYIFSSHIPSFIVRLW